MTKKHLLIKNTLTVLLTLVCLVANATVPDSIKRNLEDFDYIVTFTEENYAAFPAIIEQGYREKYETLKKQLSANMPSGSTKTSTHIISLTTRHYGRPTSSLSTLTTRR